MEFANSNSCAADSPAAMKMFYPALIFGGVSILGRTARGFLLDDPPFMLYNEYVQTPDF
jgi:hypothetical protein